MFCYFISCVCVYIYTYKLWKVLTVLSNVILSIFIYSPCYVANYPVYTHTNFKYINCIINCSNVSFLYFPHIKLSCIYTYKIWNILNILLTAVLSHIYIFPMFCFYISCVYTYRLWNILIVFSNVILSYIYIFPMLCYYYYIHLHILKSINCIVNCNIVPYLYFPHVILLFCICTCKFWNILTVLSIVIFSHNFIVPILCYYLSCI